MRAIEHYDQATVDRLCQAVAWAGGNEPTAIRLANMSVDESGMGKREPTRRAKVLGILRDALRQKSMGDHRRGPGQGDLVKYAKPAGVIASLIPVTSPYVTPVGIAIYAIKCKDAVIFSPHPASRKTTIETVRMMRAALHRQGVPEDVLQVVERPSIPLANELMAQLRSDHRHRRPGDGQGGLRLGQAGLRRRRRQRHDGHRRDREHRGSGAQHAHQQDQRQRLGLLRRRQPAGRLDASTTPSSRSCSRKAAISSHEDGEAQAAGRLLGRRGTPHRRHHRARRPRSSPRRPAFAIPADKTFFIVPERH